mmetsp:Transcript_7148/g.5413  ORF Transcript_7148/g.5413 Transcript_7148/m.5413 type:complete len:226 (-) Transcript_7148:17-694(-)
MLCFNLLTRIKPTSHFLYKSDLISEFFHPIDSALHQTTAIVIIASISLWLYLDGLFCTSYLCYQLRSRRFIVDKVLLRSIHFWFLSRQFFLHRLSCFFSPEHFYESTLKSTASIAGLPLMSLVLLLLVAFCQRILQTRVSLTFTLSQCFKLALYVVLFEVVHDQNLVTRFNPERLQLERLRVVQHLTFEEETGVARKVVNTTQLLQQQFNSHLLIELVAQSLLQI